MADQVPDNDNNKGKGFLESVRDLAFIIAVYLYFAGWIYIYNYYDFFGLSIRQVDIDFYYFLVYSVNVFMFLSRYWYYGVTFVIISVFTVRWLKFKWLNYIIGFILFIMLFYSSFQAAQRDAKADFAFRGSQLKKVRFILKKEKENTNCCQCARVNETIKEKPDTDFMSIQFKKYNNLDSLRLITATKDDYFVLITDRSVTVDNADQKDREVYAIKKENVSLIKIKN